MGILSKISEYKNMKKKERIAVQKMKHSQKKVAYHDEINKLRVEREKAGEIAKLKGERDRLKSDVENLSSFNKPKKPKVGANLKGLGQGLAKVINKGKSGIQSAKKQGFLQGAKFEPGRSNFGGSGSKGSPFGGARSIEVGGNSGSFNTSRGLEYGKKEPMKKEKSKTVTIKVM